MRNNVFLLDKKIKRYAKTSGFGYLSNTISGLKFIVLDRYKRYQKKGMWVMKKRRIKQITNTKEENKKRGSFLQVALEHSKKLGQVVSSKNQYSIYRTGVFM